MPGAANRSIFDQPHWRVIAQGFDTERWFDEGQAVGTGGILRPMRTELPCGHCVYRFASSQASKDSQYGGGWWLDYENFAMVRRFANDHGYRLKEAARLMLALPYAWTRVDVLLRAFPKQPLLAWTGLGKPAQSSEAGADGGTRWIPTQQVSVRQLYIPGLCVKWQQPKLYETVFEQPVERTMLR